MAELEIGIDERVMVARMNRPEKRNAISAGMMAALAEALREAQRDPGIGSFVLTGTGTAFCSGGDNSARAQDVEQGGITPVRAVERLQHTHQVAYAAEAFAKPLIAAVNGPAAGAGMDLALMCDLRFAGTSARFSEAYIRVGLLPGNGGCHYLPRLVGTAKALELLWTGDFVDAAEAERIGLVNRVVPDESLMETTLAFAKRLAAGPPLHQSAIKRLVNQSLRSDLRTNLDAVAAQMGVVQSSADAREAMQAWREKRTPRFEGR